MITLDHVSKIYRMDDQELRALDDVSLRINDGDFVAIIGASGSGKSTLMNVLGCLDTPTSGQYLIDGISVEDLSSDEMAIMRNRAFGFVFQHFNLLPRVPAIQQVELPLIYAGIPRKQREVMALEALTAVGLSERMYHLPNQLSGGQQQRVAIARAIVNQPRVILADEPTGNLDSRTNLEIIAIFQKLNRESGITILYVTHEREIALHARRILAMSDGRIITDQRIETPLWAPDELAAGQPSLPLPSRVVAAA